MNCDHEILSILDHGLQAVNDAHELLESGVCVSKAEDLVLALQVLGSVAIPILLLEAPASPEALTSDESSGSEYSDTDSTVSSAPAMEVLGPLDEERIEELRKINALATGFDEDAPLVELVRYEDHDIVHFLTRGFLEFRQSLQCDQHKIKNKKFSTKDQRRASPLKKKKKSLPLYQLATVSIETLFKQNIPALLSFDIDLDPWNDLDTFVDLLGPDRVIALGQNERTHYATVAAFADALKRDALDKCLALDSLVGSFAGRLAERYFCHLQQKLQLKSIKSMHGVLDFGWTSQKDLIHTFTVNNKDHLALIILLSGSCLATTTMPKQSQQQQNFYPSLKATSITTISPGRCLVLPSGHTATLTADTRRRTSSKSGPHILWIRRDFLAHPSASKR